MLRDVLCACQVKHFEGVDDIEVRLESQLDLGRFDFSLRKDHLFDALNELFELEAIALGLPRVLEFLGSRLHRLRHPAVRGADGRGVTIVPLALETTL